MLMKKLFSLIAVIGTFTATAQQVTVIEEQPNTSIAGFATNRFWDNWEIQGGAGMSFTLGTGSKIGNAYQGVGYAAVGKWLHPVFGMRFAVEGGKIDYLSGNDRSSVNTSYIFAHPDLTINLSNWIGGYRDDRIYNAILTTGAGIAGTSLRHKANRKFDFAASVGMQNRFNVCPFLSVDLTVNYTLARSNLYPVPTIKSPRFNALSWYVGVTYRFNKRYFNRVGATDEQVAAIMAALAITEEKLSDANAENQKLQRLNAEQARELENATVKITEYTTIINEETNQIEQYTAQSATAKEAVENGNYSELLFYLYGYGVLSADNKTRLNLLAEHIKKCTDDRKFRIEGFADPQTGSEQNNIRLAAKRARLAYDYLVSKGVDPERLEWINGGTKNLPFNHPEQNRVVVIF